MRKAVGVARRRASARKRVGVTAWHGVQLGEVRATLSELWAVPVLSRLGGSEQEGRFVRMKGHEGQDVPRGTTGCHEGKTSEG